MDTMISTSASYKVGALVDEQDLSELAVVASTSVIRPLYVPDSAKDPDVLAFRVLLKDPEGEQVAEAVEYRERNSSSRTVASDGAGLLIVDSLSDALPTFALPADLSVGRYFLVFQVVGDDGVLYEERRSFFYIGDKAFSITSLASFPPGSGPSGDAPLFPTKVPLLLEVGIDAGPELDPYVVWSFDGKRLGGARAADGGKRIMWTTPGNAGFYRIEVSLYPTVPSANELSSLSGVTRSITIAASPTAAFPGLPNPDSAYVSIFRFLGDLKERGIAPDSAHPLEAAFEKTVDEWLPFTSGYGLGVGPSRSYLSARPAVPVEDGAVHPSRVILSASVRRAGLIWQTVFAGDGGEEPELSVSLEETESGPTLTVRSNGLDKTIHVEQAMPFADAAQVFEIEFFPSAKVSAALSVKLILDGVSAGTVETGPLLPLSSQGYFRLGGSSASGAAEEVPDTITAVVDELAYVLVEPETPAETDVPPDETAPDPADEPSAAVVVKK